MQFQKHFDIPKLHEVGLCEDGLSGPASELAAVVLHLGGNDGTTLGSQLGPPVESTTGTLGLVVELVERLDDEVLVLAADAVLHHGVQLGTHDQVDCLLVGSERKIEAAVFVGLGCRGVGLLGGVVEGVLVGHLDLVALGLLDNLRGEDVVDVGGLLLEGARGVDLVLVALADLERRIGGVLVDSDHVQAAALALVDVDLVAMLDHDEIPTVHTAGSAHEHGKDVVGGEDGGLVLLGQLLDNGIVRSSDVVCSAVQSTKLLNAGRSARLLVVSAVVVVEESVVFEVLAVAGLEVELEETAELDLLQHAPRVLGLDRGLAVALRLVPVLPAESPASTSTAAAATRVVALCSTTASTSTVGALESAPAATSSLAAALASATEDSASSAAKASAASRCLRAVDEREAALLVLSLDVEDGLEAAGTVDLVAVSLLVLLSAAACVVLALRGPVGHAT